MYHYLIKNKGFKLKFRLLIINTNNNNNITKIFKMKFKIINILYCYIFIVEI